MRPGAPWPAYELARELASMSHRRLDYAGQMADGKVNLQSVSARPEHVTVLGLV